MKKPWHPRIRTLLREYHDGLTTTQISLLLGGEANPNAIRRALDSMPDAYIDRWIMKRESRGQYHAVWCVVVPPINCPHPQGRSNADVRTQWNYRGNLTL